MTMRIALAALSAVVLQPRRRRHPPISDSSDRTGGNAPLALGRSGTMATPSSGSLKRDRQRSDPAGPGLRPASFSAAFAVVRSTVAAKATAGAAGRRHFRLPEFLVVMLRRAT